MLEKIKTEIEKHKIDTSAKILCAISGGIDSTVMLHVLKRLNFNCIVAHCNFQLRGEESDGDEKFVRNLSEEFDFKFLSQRFDTYEYADKMQISVQMAARDLRYEWFYKISKEYECSFIALAHNSDDQVETIITNLIRGTGIRGLTGMSFLKNLLFRPLLFNSREEIQNYADIFGLKWRNDSTNATTKYSRNKIRHSIFPIMSEINNAYKNNILKSIDYLKDTEDILNHFVTNAKKNIVTNNSSKTIIDIEKLQNFPAKKTLLFEILISINIPNSLASEATNLLDNSQSGKNVTQFNISILRDRNKIIIKHNAEKEINVKIEKDELFRLKEYGIFAELEDIYNLEIQKDSKIAFLDYDKLNFPLTLRKWKNGDRFIPFGMKSFKKLSDFFIDEKLSLFEKEECLILCSDEKIVWVIAKRIDERYKITEKTKKVLKIMVN